MGQVRFSSQPYRCLFCGCGFWDMKSLQEHLRSCKRQAQKEVPDRDCLCEYCLKMFGRLSDLSRHIRRVHNLVPKAPTATCSSAYDKDTTALSVDELGPDPEIELEAENVQEQDKVMLEAEISRKPTQPDPVFSGKKRKILTEEPSDLSAKVSKDSPTGTDKMKMDTNEIGIQCSIKIGKVEHHVVIATVKSYKENRTDVTRKETHKRRWVE